MPSLTGPCGATGQPERILRLARFGLTTQRIEQLLHFYTAAFDCRETSRMRRDGSDFRRVMQVDGGAMCVTLDLGCASVEILEFDHPGEAFTPPLSFWDSSFQHFAIVVDDMRAAYRHLCSVPGWTPLSTSGPQRLPASSGSVEAFKFRDPDGHPLELLSFADTRPVYWRNRGGASLFLGIDHSAITIADTAVSIEFYRALGLGVTGHSYNHGTEQDSLDGIQDVVLDVTALAPRDATPHVELLCYRHAATARTRPLRSDAVGASRLIFVRDTGSADDAKAQHPAEVGMQDPDGHHLCVRNA